jgi:hypothetical protein
MTKRTFGCCLVALMMAGGLYGACGGDIVGEDCKIKCEDAQQTCTKKCNDEMCKTRCTTDLHDCSARCDKVSTTPKPDGG